MSELQILNNLEFGDVRLMDIDGKNYFGATDVAKALGYSNQSKAILDHCKLKGVTIREVGVVTGKKKDGSDSMQNVYLKFISEGNLYRLIARSKLPSAEKFESWIFDEVLPDIRQHWMYATDVTLDNMLNNPDFAITMLTEYKKEKEARMIAEAEVELNKPKVDYYDLVMDAQGLAKAGDIASK
ncbi:MAG TPA: BRO family protein [Clostridium sp.]